MLEHRGTFQRLGETVRSFIDFRKAHRLPPGTSATFNVSSAFETVWTP